MTDATSDAPSTDIVRTFTRDEIVGYFTRAHTAATELVQGALISLGESDAATMNQLWPTSGRKNMLDEILATVPNIGTSDFAEIDIPAMITGFSDFDIRIDWPIVLLAWYAAFAHNGIVDPQNTSIVHAIECVCKNIIDAKEAKISWIDVHSPASDQLQEAIFTELREKHKLIGPWQITRTLFERVGRSGTAIAYNGPGVLLQAKVPHCDIAAYFPFVVEMTQNSEFIWVLTEEYNAPFVKEAEELERQAAEMVREAVHDSMPLRIDAYETGNPMLDKDSEARAQELERQADEELEEAVQDSMPLRIRARELRVKMR